MVKVAPCPGVLVDLDVAVGLLGKAERLAEAEAGSLADLLGREERLEDRVEMFRRDAGAGVGDRDGDEVAAARRTGRAGQGWRRTLLHADRQPAFAVHGVAAVDGEIDQRGLELRDVGDREAIGIVDLDLDPDAAADQRADQLRDALDLRADIEHLRLQRLPAGKRQQLRGQLGGALHGFGDRVDVAAAPLLRQFAAAQEVGRGADDGQEIVEIVRDAAGELADRFHLLRLPQRFLALAALGDVDGLRHRADDGAMLVAQRAHREIEIALADRQMQPHLDPHLFALHARR